MRKLGQNIGGALGSPFPSPPPLPPLPPLPSPSSPPLPCAAALDAAAHPAALDATPVWNGGPGVSPPENFWISTLL